MIWIYAVCMMYYSSIFKMYFRNMNRGHYVKTKTPMAIIIYRCLCNSFMIMNNDQIMNLEVSILQVNDSSMILFWGQKINSDEQKRPSPYG